MPNGNTAFQILIWILLLLNGSPLEPNEIVEPMYETDTAEQRTS